MKPISKILIVCNRVPYPLKDGGALAMHALIKAWSHTEKEVHLLAMNTSRHPVSQNDLPPLFSEIASFEMCAINTDLRPAKLMRNFFFSKKPEHADRFYNTAFEQLLLQKIATVKPDIIQLESIYLHEYVPAIRRNSKAFVVQRLHNIEAQVWQRLAMQTKSFLKKGYLHHLAKRLAVYEEKVWAESDALLPIAMKDEQYISDQGVKTPSLLLPFGIDLQQIAYADFPANNWQAYHIGAMDWLPNIEAMEWMQAAIVPAIREKVPHFTFHFAGRNMPEKLLKYKKQEFYCAGEVPNVHQFIEDKQILIVPLRSGSGIRVKTLEAMAMGKLVISTQIGIEGIEAKDKIHFLRADTPSEFATALLWAEQNKSAARIIAHNAQLLILAQYDQAKLMKRLLRFVENL